MDSQPPQKPWERRAPGTISAPVNYRSTNLGPYSGPSAPPGPPVLTRMAPPVPPRPVQQSYRPSYGSYGSYGSSYSPYGSSLYGGYSPYSYGGGAYGGGAYGGGAYGGGAYGGGAFGGGAYGLGGYNRLGLGDELAPSRFVQQAEESSRGAFQSIESIVQAFASVSMMLDATFSAVYNSFRAVLDVANHLTRLRAHLTRVLSAFALVRTLRYLYRRLQRLLGGRADSDVDDLWSESGGDALAAATGPGRLGAGMEEQSVKSWPILLFFAVVLGGPYLIWKLLSSSSSSEQTATEWASGEDDHVVARAEYDFTAASEEEISVQAGEMLNLAPKEQQPRLRGWLLASLDGHTTGLVPSNYVKILGKRRGRRQAEAERLAQAQQTSPQAAPAAPLRPSSSSSSSSSSSPPEQLLEAVFTDTAGASSPTLNVSDLQEL